VLEDRAGHQLEPHGPERRRGVPFVGAAGPATYFGLPVVGFAVQSFTNGVLIVNGQATLSDYGGNFVHKGTRIVDFPLPPAP